MSRRDTIIIAVLVNAGLLLVLFATAIRSGDKKKEPATLTEGVTPSKEAVINPVTTEELLNEYIATGLPSLPATPGHEEIVILEDIPQGHIPGFPPQPNLQPTVQPNLAQANPTGATPGLHENVPVATMPQMSPQMLPPSEQVVEVTVQKGEYLEKIAKANNSTVSAIMKANNLASTQLKIGQVLKVPVVKKEDKKEAQSPLMDGDYYVVKEGDNPWAIATRCHVKLDELLRINDLDSEKAKKLRPGDKLRIR